MSKRVHSAGHRKGCGGDHPEADLKRPLNIPPAEGKLAVLLPGMGAVATTMIAGALLARRGKAQPLGSLTPLGVVPIREFVPLASLEQVEFGGWDIFPDNAYEAAVQARVLKKERLDEVKDE